MKRVEYHRINLLTIILLILTIFSFYYAYSNGFSLFGSIVVMVFGFLFTRIITVSVIYNIQYDNKTLYLFNKLFPFITYEYEFRDIEQLYITGVINKGNSLFVITASSKRNFGITGCDENDLQDLLDFFQKIKEGRDEIC